MLERSILVVTSDDAMRQKLVESLRRISPFVYGVCSLDKAIGVLESFNFSLVVVDTKIEQLIRSRIRARAARRVVLIEDGEKAERGDFPVVSFSQLMVEPEKALKENGAADVISKRRYSNGR